MQYRTDIKSGNELSIIGFGCMRFPASLTKTEQLIIKAVQSGINYFDTAYVYGNSEEVLGTIIDKNNFRDKVFIATKMPLPRCKTYSDFDTFFQTQLERLKTNYIDYYLLHAISDTNLWKTLCELGIEKWIKEKKENGQIKNIGFSFHGIQSEFIKLLDVYNWDFCQIQYNYLNTNYQAGTAGLEAANKKGLPVFIMEPLLGGKLADGLPKKAVDKFYEVNSSFTPAAWAMRWLWNKKEVIVVLSGMNEMSQLDNNIETANNSANDMITAAENDTYETVTKLIEATYKVPCTGCNYCLPCPKRVNIPACFAAYNSSYTNGMMAGLTLYLTSTGLLDERKKYSASNCTECGACEKKCPQNIQIIKSLKKVKRRLEPFWLIGMLKLFMKIKGW
jgi:predicted aldo/keto reductase-like oxidoreductase